MPPWFREITPGNPEEHSECNLPELHDNESLPLACWNGLFYAIIAEIRYLYKDIKLRLGSRFERGRTIRSPFFVVELTLRALGSVPMREHSKEIIRQLPEEVQQHMSTKLSATASEMPTSDRTFALVFHVVGGCVTSFAPSKRPGLKSSNAEATAGPATLSGQLDVNDPSTANEENDPSGAVRNGAQRMLSQRYVPMFITGCDSAEGQRSVYGESFGRGAQRVVLAALCVDDTPTAAGGGGGGGALEALLPESDEL
ncbi:hypothetical protein Q7P35_001344 [Cladosporium inversicolor]